MENDTLRLAGSAVTPTTYGNGLTKNSDNVKWGGDLDSGETRIKIPNGGKLRFTTGRGFCQS